MSNYFQGGFEESLTRFCELELGFLTQAKGRNSCPYRRCVRQDPRQNRVCFMAGGMLAKRAYYVDGIVKS